MKVKNTSYQFKDIKVVDLYLLDSDVAKKICQYQLLDELTGALKCGLDDLLVLPQLKFQLKLKDDKKALEKLGSPESVEQARLLVENALEVEIIAESANPILELNRPDIDTGEAILFAALYESSDDSLLSGDKRAFVALSKIEGMALVDSLWARMISMEEAMFIILKSSDFDLVSSKVRARKDVDMSLSIAFGRTSKNELNEVFDALFSFMNSLHVDTFGKYVLPK
ncbi:hypothetical protein [Nitrincola alkalilacustris]|uniref:hypothetical protein n=1 Tax=Nitrincola alkalilacustris TaxID=1571224 RepID=UPI00124CF329|nr:hypothetical protein [Nitrincola alkalilacustris]